MKYAFFIRTYPRDYEWLKYSLRSLQKNAPGVPVVVTSPGYRDHEACMEHDNLGWYVASSEHKDDYIGQQITKLRADEYLNSHGIEPEFVIHIDSDTVLTGDPEKLFIDGKPQMLRTPYDQLPVEVQTWKACTETQLGWGVSHEYMRRLPLVYPFGLYAAVRGFLTAKHNKSFDLWARDILPGKLSEFNLMGAYAFEYMHDAFHWIDTDCDPLPELVACQRWSWGGIDTYRAELERQFPSK